MKKEHVDHRIAWIDISKAIGICLIVLGHFLPSGHNFKIIIYSFHVPLFFILSGYVFSTNAGIFNLIKKRIRTLIIPYIIYIFVSFPYYFITNSKITASDLAKQLFMVQGKTIWNAPLWFLPILFFVSILSYFILKYCNFFVHLLLIAGFWFFAYIAYSNKIFILNIFGMNRVIFLLPFFLIGNILREYKVMDKIKIPLVNGALLMIVNVFFTLILHKNNISIYNFKLSNYWGLILTSMVGSFSIILISTRLPFISIYKILSSHTISIMATHYYILEFINKTFSLNILLTIMVAMLTLLGYIVFFGLRDKFKRLLNY